MRALRIVLSEDQLKETRPLTGGFAGNALEDIVYERVEDSHRLVRDTSIGVYLFEDYDRRK